ncbi:hypothetical protein LPMP_201880 [Leishmania panamensis]|uniref:Thioredoxin-like protein, putative n=1 Tax=Leishmania panamensis TaxID=5679 RepID=A0A088RNP8_LEIPA|nr:hypothetical protein LPMP_201880 [Leishmania panamensis]AIN97682.1 hypothetical protein LPMP_201880 [Leishmania panamensis]
MRLSTPSAVRLFGALLVIACFVHASVAFPYGRSSAVTELTSSSLNAFVNTHKPVVILFYAPWCGHCKQFHPEFERFAQLMKGIIRVGAIDADRNTHIGQQFGVRGFPTIKYWRSGAKSVSSAQNYQGQRTAAALQSLMIGEISSSEVTKVTTAEEIKHAARNSPKKMIGVLLSLKNKVPPMLSVMSLSPKLKQLPLVFSGNCNLHKGVAEAFGVTQLPMLGVLRYTPAEGDAAEKFELIIHEKNNISYESVAHFFLDCAENQCSSGTKSFVKSVNLDEDEKHLQTHGTARQATVALPVVPVEYTPKVISQFCAPQTHKIRGQSALCVFSLSKRVHLDQVHKYFKNDPLLFFEASQHKEELLHELHSKFGVQLVPLGEAPASLTESIVVLRHSKPRTARYALLEHISSDEDLQAALQRILNGEVHLISVDLGAV